MHYRRNVWLTLLLAGFSDWKFSRFQPSPIPLAGLAVCSSIQENSRETSFVSLFERRGNLLHTPPPPPPVSKDCSRVR